MGTADNHVSTNYFFLFFKSQSKSLCCTGWMVQNEWQPQRNSFRWSRAVTISQANLFDQKKGRDLDDVRLQIQHSTTLSSSGCVFALFLTFITICCRFRKPAMRSGHIWLIPFRHIYTVRSEVSQQFESMQLFLVVGSSVFCFFFAVCLLETKTWPKALLSLFIIFSSQFWLWAAAPLQTLHLLAALTI